MSSHAALESDTGFSALAAAAARAVGLALIGVAAVLAFVFAAVAAAAVGLIVLGAALALRMAPRRRSSASVLNARHTPSGWVVETGAAPRV